MTDSRPMHRVTQFVTHLRAHVGPDEADLARRLLPASAWELFDAMPVADRRHGLDVVARLVDAGRDDPDLLVAALLHDAGKGHALRLPHRVAGVVLEALAPRRLAAMAERQPTPANPWYVYLHHAELSAAAAESAGASRRSVAFIRGQAAEADASLARALHEADEAS
jgi:hypothetical protein